MITLYFLASFLLSFILTYYSIPFISAIAFKYNIIDNPDGKLKVHKQPTPYLGGVAVFFGLVSTLALVFPPDNTIILSLIGGCFILLCVGLIDDILAITPAQKFIGQAIAAGCFLRAGFYLREAFFSFIPNIILSFLWILTIVNAFNLIDIMDGLATITALSITTCFFCVALLYGELSIALLLCIFMGALMAFFFYNAPPALIYLGDAGSLFIGGFIGSLPFLFPWGTYTSYGFLAPILILFVPLAELGMLILIRTYKGIPPYKGSPDHFAIYFKRAGWSIWLILAYVVFITGLAGSVALAFAFSFISLLEYALLFILFITLWLAVLARNAWGNVSKKD